VARRVCDPENHVNEEAIARDGLQSHIKELYLISKTHNLNLFAAIKKSNFKHYNYYTHFRNIVHDLQHLCSLFVTTCSNEMG
jgi:hypothetical protein